MVLLLVDVRGVLSTVGCRLSQLADEPDDLDSYIRAIWPVTEVFRQRLFAAVNDRADYHDRHDVVVILPLILSRCLGITLGIEL